MQEGLIVMVMDSVGGYTHLPSTHSGLEGAVRVIEYSPQGLTSGDACCASLMTKGIVTISRGLISGMVSTRNSTVTSGLLPSAVGSTLSKDTTSLILVRVTCP